MTASQADLTVKRGFTLPSTQQPDAMRCAGHVLSHRHPLGCIRRSECMAGESVGARSAASINRCSHRHRRGTAAVRPRCWAPPMRSFCTPTARDHRLCHYALVLST
ncbi:hypothetical protein M409DRAFT_51926 [Zasmidium cellare ATCC 36951]|uniref:Uncharacterized protein n=1 Tax=Zasmidium cellare ATCC 36951 TaxID=1080233 RepID=A0A6A6CXT6_ZASCE|nr:uncharacterized protein M409DRAFT_51926 [Zasmidium cellare ATCC 36951]KAF2170176.1 hypothetical protein M409DRAFT_51926 [Zasmidium cellare ATCC 36951]